MIMAEVSKYIWGVIASLAKKFGKIVMAAL